MCQTITKENANYTSSCNPTNTNVKCAPVTSRDGIAFTRVVRESFIERCSLDFAVLNMFLFDLVTVVALCRAYFTHNVGI